MNNNIEEPPPQNIKTTWFFTNQRRILNFLLLICFLLTVALVVEQYWIYSVRLSETKSSLLKKKPKIRIESSYMKNRGYGVDTPGCKIPLLDPFHKSVRLYIENHTGHKLKCDLPQLFYMDGKVLKANPEEMKKFKKLQNVNCGYVPFHRKTDDVVEYDNYPIFWIEDSTKIFDEFIRVVCYNSSSLVYQDFFATIQVKPDVEFRVKEALEKTNPNEEKMLNVLLIGVGSASKNHYRRHLQRTDKFIRKHLTYVELNGYNKLGRSTLSNMLPFLTGKLEKDYEEVVVREMLDFLPLIWKTFAKLGYRTLFAEDSTSNATFNGMWKGFLHQQTDYYMRPLTVEFEKSRLLTKELNVAGCYRNRSEASVILRWMLDFFDKFKGDPLYAHIFLNRLSRQNYNSVAFYDQSLLNSFKMLHSKGHLNNTIVVFFSEQGFYPSAVRTSYNGHLEEMLPFLLLILPQWFPKQYPQLYKNAKLNEQRLVTALDIYATLLDVVDGFSQGRENFIGNNRSVSLFSPISEERTCESAGINIRYCGCINEQTINNNSIIAVEVARKLVDYINSLTVIERRHCKFFTLSEVTDITVSTDITNFGSYRESYITLYDLIVLVVPDYILYKGAVRFMGHGKYYQVDSKVHRLNFFIDKSNCLSKNF